MPTNKEIIETAYGNFAKGDVPAVLAAMDPKIEWTEAVGMAAVHGTLVGTQAIVDGVFMRLGEIGDNFSLDVTSWSPRATPWWHSARTPGAARARASLPRQTWPTCGPSTAGRSLESSSTSTLPKERYLIVLILGRACVSGHQRSRTVEQLPRDVQMSGMPRRLFDHVQHDPTNVRRLVATQPVPARSGAESGVVASTASDCAHWSR